MAKKITTDEECSVFIGNLDPRVSEEILWELFLQAGPIKSIHIPCDKETGKQRSFAFVEFSSNASVHYAWELLDGIRLYNRALTVRPQSFNNGETVERMPSNVMPATEFYNDFYKKYEESKHRPQSEPRKSQRNEETNYQRNSSFTHPTINRSLSSPAHLVNNRSIPWQQFFNVIPYLNNTSTPHRSLPAMRIPFSSPSPYAGSPPYSLPPSSDTPYRGSPYGYMPTRQSSYHR